MENNCQNNSQIGQNSEAEDCYFHEVNCKFNCRMFIKRNFMFIFNQTTVVKHGDFLILNNFFFQKVQIFLA